MYQTNSAKFPTESFIKKHLMNNNGTLATYMKESDDLDSDLVKGREALSESLGLWLQYALEKGDPTMFQSNYSILTTYFLKSDGLVYWKLDPDGTSRVTTNASIDDFRIASTLIQAADKWGREDYRKTANKISQYLNKNNRRGQLLVDYYDSAYQSKSAFVTLSYIDPASLTNMFKNGGIDQTVHRSMTQLLTNIPGKGPFYAKKYHVTKKEFRFDQRVNIIDQMLIALHRSYIGLPSDELLAFIKKEFQQHGVIYGRYYLDTKKAAVNYESPALYAIAILYCKEIGETEFAQALFNRMIQFREDNPLNTYYGGYSVYNGDTHIFDNLYPLVAEMK